MSFFRSGPASSLDAQESVHASDAYRPSHVLPTAEMAFAHWTERVAYQPALVTARELAGLSNENLCALAREFEQAPRRRRSDVHRLLTPASVASLGLGFALLLATQAMAVAALTWVAVALVFAGFAGLGAAAMVSLRGAPIEQAYARLGLYVGELNEQHPWLYKTMLLLKHAAADDYRKQVLTQRGTLRGVDYLMMREIASVHESLELTQTAHTVRGRVQQPGPV